MIYILSAKSRDDDDADSTTGKIIVEEGGKKTYQPKVHFDIERTDREQIDDSVKAHGVVICGV